MFGTVAIFFVLFQKLYSKPTVFEIEDKSQCVQKILKRVFSATLVQYHNLDDWVLRDNQVLILDKLDHPFACANIAMILTEHQLESVINNVGYDRNVLLIIFDQNKINRTEILLKTWFKYRTKLAIASLSNGSFTLITNIYVKHYEFCPNMNYQIIENICSGSTQVTTKTISANYYCTLNISHTKVSPFVNEITSTRKKGIMVSWMLTFAQLRGFTLNFIDNYEYQNEFINNGSFHKLIADLVKRKLDVAIGHLFMNSSEEYPVDFGPVIYTDKVGFVHRKLNKISNFRKMIVVFDKDVWIYLIATYIIMVPIYYLLNYLVENVLLNSVSLTDIFRLSIGSAIPYVPNSVPVRTLFISFCMLGITLNSIYTGKLTDIFINPPTDFNEDIWDHGVRVHISYIMERLSCISYYSFRRGDLRHRKDAGNAIVNKTDQELLKLVSKIVFFSYTGYFAR